MGFDVRVFKPDYIYTKITKDDWFSLVFDDLVSGQGIKKSKKGLHFRYERWRVQRLVDETYRMYEIEFFNKNGRFFKERLLRKVQDRLRDEQLAKYFVFASEKTIRRAITSLTDTKLIGVPKPKKNVADQKLL